MARPKPAQETAIKKISVRWSKDDHIAFLRLGGSRWLRELVQKLDRERQQLTAERKT